MKPELRPPPPDESNLIEVLALGDEKELKFAWHYHPEYQLTYILTNHGTRYVGNCIENYDEDDLVLLGSNLPHCWINAPDGEKGKAVIVYLKEALMNKEWLDSVEFDSIRKLLNLSVRGIKFDKGVALKMKEKLVSLFDLPPFEKLIVLLNILQELSHEKDYHLLCEEGFSYEPNTDHDERILAIHKYVQKNYRNKISLADVAAHVNMSDKYLSRFFSKIMKKPFFEYLHEFRISQACKMLRETNKQISEICYASGFETIPFFYRQFKKFKQCSPKDYRSKYK